jgi:hypothetical protein
MDDFYILEIKGDYLSPFTACPGKNKANPLLECEPEG